MPLAEDAYEKIRNMILTGELPPETALTENSIVDRIEIGKTPVREAMRRLVLEGLLDVTPRLGYMVKAVTREDVDNLFTLRVILETAAAELAVDRLDDASVDRLVALSDAGYDPDDLPSLIAYTNINAEFHDIIAKGSGNRRLVDLINQLMAESRRFVHLAVMSEENGRAVRQQHMDIADAFRRRDRVAVAEAMRVHVEDGRQVVLDGFIVGRLTAAPA
jgi:DNA-binding GntR family transcriptional regulator